MPTPSQNVPPQNVYDPRWFIWTIVFLVITGISLVSYIVLSDNGTNDSPELLTTRSVQKTHKTPEASTTELSK